MLLVLPGSICTGMGLDMYLDGATGTVREVQLVRAPANTDQTLLLS